MAVYFFDSSALVKRYIAETGSGWVSGLTDPTAGNINFIAGITAVEVVSAVARRARAGHLSSADKVLVWGRLQSELPKFFQTVDITRNLLADAANLADKYALRGYDAVQLAAAREVNYECLTLGLALTVISSDNALNKAAALEGLTVDNPDNH
jgi:predicted nucleic acid-binding protein